MKNILHSIASCMICCLPTIAFAASPAPNGSIGQQKVSVRYSPWSLVEDFNHGIPGWMSFPLAQDIGYDPSIYTTSIDGKFALVRDVITEGQKTVRVGMLQPVRFRITPASLIHLEYKVEMGGAIEHGTITVGTESGRKYSILMPTCPGEHTIDIRGSALHVPSVGDDAKLITVEVDTANSALGAHNRLIVRSMRIDAVRQATVPIVSPRIEHFSASDISIAATIVNTSDPVLPIRLGAKSSDAEITLYDGRGIKESVVKIAKTPMPLGPSLAPGLWRAHIEDGGAKRLPLSRYGQCSFSPEASAYAGEAEPVAVPHAVKCAQESHS